MSNIQDIKSKFTVYYRQQEAIDHQNEEPEARVFAFESLSLDAGKRQFISVPLATFYDFYKNFKSGRWFYELIKDGSPCRPYFDLEFLRQFNQSLDEHECYKDFISICKATFAEALNIQLEDANFLTLDSTTKDKYSAHVIVHLPNKQLFPSNLALKPLVAIICSKMLEAQKCIVKKGTEEDFLCDRSVYSKNRQFRLYYSSKVGKTAKLVYADYCNFYEVKPSGQTLFYDTLVVPKDLSDYELVNMEPLIKVSQGSIHQVKMPKSLEPKTSGYQVVQGSYRPDNIRTLAYGAGESVFPLLDEYILSLMKPLCPAVRIRKWELTYCETTHQRRIIYQFSGCRFCYRILREHQSNNVYWIIDLSTFACFQKCFDYDCRSFTSRLFQVPYQAEEETKKNVDSVFSSFGIAPPDPPCKQNYTVVVVKPQ